MSTKTNHVLVCLTVLSFFPNLCLVLSPKPIPSTDDVNLEKQVTNMDE